MSIVDNDLAAILTIAAHTLSGLRSEAHDSIIILDLQDIVADPET